MLGVVITVVLGAACIIGIWNEDKLIAFEDRIVEKVRNRKN
jgi:hypothetical protein